VFLLKTRARQSDFVKLLDFGISKFSQLSGESGFSMTRTGAVMGTPYYMSPEQAKGAKGMDHRADLYAVGVILYEAVTGQVPFNADTFNELLFKIVLEEPLPIQQLVPDIDPGFATIVNKAMAREPAHRFQSSEEFQTALTTWAQTGAAPALHAPSIPQARAAQASSSGSGAQVSLGTGTPGTWSSTGSYSGASAEQLKKSKAPLFAALGIVAVLAIGGGVAALTLGGGGASAEADQQAQAASAEQAAALAAVKKAEEAARKAEEAARKAEEDAKVKAAQASSQLASAEEKHAAEEARLKAEAEARKAADLRQATRQAARAPAPTRTKTADKPAAPAPAPTDGQTSGRKIRTEL
jgi:serine/threonine-protein kinase